MSKLVKTPETFAPLANGPLPRPSGMTNLLAPKIMKPLIPGYCIVFGLGALSFYYFVQRPINKTKAVLPHIDADALFEEIKEYGVFKTVKASWQED